MRTEQYEMDVTLKTEAQYLSEHTGSRNAVL